MCGIFGYSEGKDQRKNSVFFESLKHRGPDGQDVNVFGEWCLGHLRLSIIDTSAKANQPMSVGGDTIVFNGEIYNYIELKNKYLKGERLKTSSDTEILLVLLKKFGVTILNELNGMFAFAWYSNDEQTLTLVRDRFGVKPLYWVQNKKEFLFASETKPLAKLLNCVTLNEKSVDSFVKETISDTEEESFIKGIYQVLPGHYLEINKNKIIKKVNWYKGSDYSFDKSMFSDHQKTVDYFEELLTNAIEIRHRSDVPVAITLSGGLDSTTIYTLAKEKFGSKAQPITYSHGNKKTDESKLAEKLAKGYKDKLIKVKQEPNLDINKLKLVLKYLEFPIWNNAATAFWDTYKKIHSLGYKVIIEGHGSDELLGGYPHMVNSAWEECFCRGQILKSFELYKVFSQTLNLDLNQSTKKIDNIFSFVVFGLKKMKTRIFHNNTGLFEKTIRKAFDRDIIPIVLRAFDRLAMAHSIESRSPFMDYRVVEFCRHLPMEYKVNKLGNKAILREILRKYGKDDIYKRKIKMGFASDVPDFYNTIKNRNEIIKIVENNSDKKYRQIKDKALNVLSFKKVQWHEVDPIWKILSLEITSNIYRNV